MADTGAPWNIPYVENADLVKDYPTASLALANAIDAGLDVAAGLVAVKSAIFTGTQTASTASGSNFAITDLSIAHTLANAANKLIITGFCGLASESSKQSRVGIAAADDGTLIAIGDTAGSRPRVTASGSTETVGDLNGLSHSFTIVYAPGDVLEHTYTLRAINVSSGTVTVNINRTNLDTDAAGRPRAASGLVIQEVRV